jgi:hypothetical protein
MYLSCKPIWNPPIVPSKRTSKSASAWKWWIHIGQEVMMGDIDADIDADMDISCLTNQSLRALWFLGTLPEEKE